MASQPTPRQLQLELPASLTAIYSNTVIISHTQNEVIFDFIQVMPNDPRARVQSRLVMAPANAKLFLRALQDNLQRYEERNGEIKLPQQPPSLAEQLFDGVRPPEPDDEGSTDSA